MGADGREGHVTDIPTSRPGLAVGEAGLWGLHPQLWYPPDKACPSPVSAESAPVCQVVSASCPAGRVAPRTEGSCLHLDGNTLAAVVAVPTTTSTSSGSTPDSLCRSTGLCCLQSLLAVQVVHAWQLLVECGAQLASSDAYRSAPVPGG